MSTYIPAEELRSLAEHVIGETKARLIIIYPFDDIPDFLLEVVQSVAANVDANIVVVLHHSGFRKSLSRIASYTAMRHHAAIEIRVVGRLYNCCFVNKHKCLVILPNSYGQFSDAHFGWFAEAIGYANEMYFETLLYVNDVVKKSHKLFTAPGNSTI